MSGMDPTLELERMMKRKPMMTPAEFARWTELNVIVANQELGYGRMTPEMWEEWRDLRDNHVKPPQHPEPGSPATFSIGSDRYAYEVVAATLDGKKVWARDQGTEGDGECFTYRPTTGRYMSKGANCGFLYLGHAENYRDPSF